MAWRMALPGSAWQKHREQPYRHRCDRSHNQKNRQNRERYHPGLHEQVSWLDLIKDMILSGEK
jgi:hypothetical protein